MTRIPYPNPSSAEQWAIDYLDYIGAPAKSANDPRVKFLVGWQQMEGNQPSTNTYATEHNPLSTSQPEPGSSAINSAGVQGYRNIATGLQATQTTMQQSFDSPIYNELRNPNANIPSLSAALAGSNWSGSGGNSSGETSYAYSVGSTASGGAIYPPDVTPSSGGQSGSVSGSGNGKLRIGFLHTLQGILNPDMAPSLSANVGKDVTNIIFLPATDTGKIALMIAARGTFVFFGLGFVVLGTLILFKEATGAASGAITPIERVQRIVTAPERAALSRERVVTERLAEERRGQTQRHRERVYRDQNTGQTYRARSTPKVLHGKD